MCGVQRAGGEIPPTQLQWVTNIIEHWDNAITMQTLFTRARIQPQEHERHYIVFSLLDVKTKHGLGRPPNTFDAFWHKITRENVESATYWLRGLYLDQQGRLRQLKKCADL